MELREQFDNETAQLSLQLDAMSEQVALLSERLEHQEMRTLLLMVGISVLFIWLVIIMLMKGGAQKDLRSERRVRRAKSASSSSPTSTSTSTMMVTEDRDGAASTAFDSMHTKLSNKLNAKPEPNRASVCGSPPSKPTCAHANEVSLLANKKPAQRRKVAREST